MQRTINTERHQWTHAAAMTVCVATVLLTAGTPAHATGDLYGSDAVVHGGGYKDGGPIFRRSVRLGAAVVVEPEYEGSDEVRVYGLPIIRPDLSAGDSGAGGLLSRYVTFEGIDDVRLKLIQADGLTAGPLGGYAFGRDEDDGDLLEGLGDVDDGAVVGAFVAYTVGGLTFDVVYQHQVSGNVDGYRLTFGGEIEREIGAHSTASVRVGATYADDNYTSAYFGVSDAQAANSVAQLAAFDAGSGIKDVHVEFGAVLAIDDRWALHPELRYARLVGDAADSPIVESEDQLSGRLGLSYKFYLD